MGELPAEYVDLVLCRDVYHCAPSVLDAQDWERIATHLICLEVEGKVRRQNENRGLRGR